MLITFAISSSSKMEGTVVIKAPNLRNNENEELIQELNPIKNLKIFQLKW